MDTARPFALAAMAALLVVMAVPPSAHAGSRGSVGGEVWFGGGVNSPDYNDDEMAVARGGLGVLIYERVSLGANLQIDRDHWFGFGYAAIVLPAVGSVEPFGRFHAGQRDDTRDGTTQWSAGLRYGMEPVKFYAEVFGIIKPGEGTGVCIGIVF